MTTVRPDLEAERQRAVAHGQSAPPTPVAHVRRVTTGRSTDPVWWCTGDGWSAVVKHVRPPDGDLGWDDGWRELLAHRAHLLADLPAGIRAPAHLASVERSDGSVSLWLEGIDRPTGGRWPFDWYGTAAERLGRTQGAFVASGDVPAFEWLNRGDLAAYAADHPCPPADGSDDLRCDDAVLDALASLPATLCHFDLHPRNVLGGGDDVVVIDWASVGVGAVGEDASTLVASAVLDGHVGGGRLPDLASAVTAGYASGLRGVGLGVDEPALGRALRALLVVRLGWVVARKLADDDVTGPQRAAAEALAGALARWSQAARRQPPYGAVVGEAAP